MDIVKQARDLMYSQTQINKAPSWRLTEIAINKGKKLAKKYNENEKLILTSLYLAHTVFDQEWGGEVELILEDCINEAELNCKKIYELFK